MFINRAYLQRLEHQIHVAEMRERRFGALYRQDIAGPEPISPRWRNPAAGNAEADHRSGEIAGRAPARHRQVKAASPRWSTRSCGPVRRNLLYAAVCPVFAPMPSCKSSSARERSSPAASFLPRGRRMCFEACRAFDHMSLHRHSDHRMSHGES